MIILGLILMAAAAAAVAGVLISSTDNVPVEVFGYSLDTQEAGWLFAAGAVAGLLFAFGLSLITGSIRRSTRRRREARETARAQRRTQREAHEREAQIVASTQEAGGMPARGTPTGTGLLPSENDTPRNSDEPSRVDLTTAERADEPATPPTPQPTADESYAEPRGR